MVVGPSLSTTILSSLQVFTLRGNTKSDNGESYGPSQFKDLLTAPCVVWRRLLEFEDGSTVVGGGTSRCLILRIILLGSPNLVPSFSQHCSRKFWDVGLVLGCYQCIDTSPLRLVNVESHLAERYSNI